MISQFHEKKWRLKNISILQIYFKYCFNLFIDRKKQTYFHPHYVLLNFIIIINLFNKVAIIQFLTSI